MICSFCRTALPPEDDEHTLPNLIVSDKADDLMLQLHAECVQQVIDGLIYGKKLLVH